MPQDRLTTGKRVDRPATTRPPRRAPSARWPARSRAEASQRAVEASRNAMPQTETALGDAGELLQQAREAMVGGRQCDATATTSAVAWPSSSPRPARAAAAVANRTDGAGSYLFGGQGAAQPPFVDAAGGVQYRGIAGERRTEPATDLPLTIDGDGVFMPRRTGNGVFADQRRGRRTAARWIDAGQVTDPSALTGSTYSLQFSVAAGATTYAVLQDGLPTARDRRRPTCPGRRSRSTA